MICDNTLEIYHKNYSKSYHKIQHNKLPTEVIRTWVSVMKHRCLLPPLVCTEAQKRNTVFGTFRLIANRYFPIFLYVVNKVV